MEFTKSASSPSVTFKEEVNQGAQVFKDDSYDERWDIFYDEVSQYIVSLSFGCYSANV
jgi:hypothetical protein